MGGRSFPKCRCEGQARGDKGDRRCGDVLEEKKTHKKKIYMGEMNFFFFSLNQVQCIREFSYLCMLRD